MMSSSVLFALYFLGGIILGCLVGMAAMRIFPAWLFKNMGLSLVFPSAMIAFFLPLLWGTNSVSSLLVIQGLLNAPLAMLPCVARYLTLPPGTGRAAMSLGAMPVLRFQKLWLPLLAVPFTLSVLLTAFMLTLCMAVAP